MRPAEALEHHRSILRKQFGKSSELALASGAQCPPFRTVKYWWDATVNKLFRIDIPNLLEDRKEGYARLGHSVSFSGDYSNIAIQTAIMRRVSKLASSSDISFVDSTSTVDCEHHSVTLVLTASPIGALPIGVIISKSQSESAYTEGFTLLKTIMEEDAFGGRGPNQGFILFSFLEHSFCFLPCLRSFRAKRFYD